MTDKPKRSILECEPGEYHAFKGGSGQCQCGQVASVSEAAPPKMCEDCEGESRTGTGQHGMAGEKCWCPCHKRGDGVAVPMPGYWKAGLASEAAPPRKQHTVECINSTVTACIGGCPTEADVPVPEWAMEAARNIGISAHRARSIRAAWKRSEEAQPVKQLAALRESFERSRPLCPDHRDKQRGGECMACAREAAEARVVELLDLLREVDLSPRFSSPEFAAKVRAALAPKGGDR